MPSYTQVADDENSVEESADVPRFSIIKGGNPDAIEKRNVNVEFKTWSGMKAANKNEQKMT